jgi:hypothetical protein
VLDDFVAQFDCFDAKEGGCSLSQSGSRERNVWSGVRCPLEFGANCAEGVKVLLFGHGFQGPKVIVLGDFAVVLFLTDIKSSKGEFVLSHRLYIKAGFGRFL